MKKFFERFGRNKKNGDGKIFGNDFQEKNFKKLSPNISVKRSKFFVFILLVVFLSAIIGAIVGKIIDTHFLRDGFVDTRNIRIKSDGCDAGEAVSLKVSSCVVGLRCIIKDEKRSGKNLKKWSFFPFFGPGKDSFDDFGDDSEGEFDDQDDVKLVEGGSGVIVEKDDENLYIITNFHVVQHVLKSGKNGLIEVHFGRDIKKYSAANVLDYDPKLDIAVLKIPLSGVRGKTFSCAEIGNSDKLKQGEEVFCVGSPTGINYNQTMTHGIVSAVDREMKLDGVKEPIKAIQTDAAMNPGNSGGGLFDREGKLIGISVAKIGKCIGPFSQQMYEGLNLALRINDIYKIVRKIIDNKNGKIIEKLPTLGIIMADETENIFSIFGDIGVLVKNVVPGSAAEKAGILPGDIIIEFDGNKVKNADDLNFMISNKREKTAKIKILRMSSRRRGAAKKKELEVVFD